MVGDEHVGFDVTMEQAQPILPRAAPRECSVWCGDLDGLGIGTPSPALWGILAGLLRFVPYIGTLLAAVLSLAMAAAVAPGCSMVASVALLLGFLEPLVGYAVEPLSTFTKW